MMAYEQQQEMHEENLQEPVVDDAGDVYEGKEEYQQTEGADDSIEERARRMGWKGKEEYSGPEDNFVGAEEFVRKADEELPVMRNQLYKYDKTVKELQQTVKDMHGMVMKAEERGYMQAMEDVQRKKLSAVEDGDVEAYRQAENKERELREQREQAQKPKQQPQAAEIPPQALAWQEKNKHWFEVDEGLTEAFSSMVKVRMKDAPGVPVHEHLERATEDLKRIYPNKFGMDSRKFINKRSASVEDSGGGAPKKSNGKTYNDLPPEAKAACDRMVRQGALTKDEYLKYYDWSK